VDGSLRDFRMRVKAAGHAARLPVWRTNPVRIRSDLVLRALHPKEMSAMDHTANHITDHQRRVLDFALDTFGLQHPWPEAERTLGSSMLRGWRPLETGAGVVVRPQPSRDPGTRPIQRTYQSRYCP
jgi:hypothetical protein